MSEYSICHYPYTTIQINKDGNISCCCHPWCSSYFLGNILKQPFEEIWNGERAKEFRKQFIEDNYKYCKLDTCIKGGERKIKATYTAENYPDVVSLCYDKICNVECIFCRNCYASDDLSAFDENIDVWLPEVCKNAERVLLSGIGEALASKHTRNVMKKIVTLYPKIKLDILSNGVLMDEKNINELGIINNLGIIRISVHAVKKSTYDKLVKKSDFNRIMKNIKFVSDLKKQNKIDQFELRFVINAYNYKEMPAYAQMAKKLGANVTFLNLLYNDDNKERFDYLNIISEKHPKYNDFLKVLKNPIFKEDFVFINDELFNLKPVNKPLFPLWHRK